MSNEGKQLEDSHSTQKNNQLNHYIEQVLPFVAVAIFTFITYCFGWAYLSGFFGRLGISLDSLHLPNIYFLRKAAIPTISSIIFICLYCLPFRFSQQFFKIKNIYKNKVFKTESEKKKFFLSCITTYLIVVIFCIVNMLLLNQYFNESIWLNLYKTASLFYFNYLIILTVCLLLFLIQLGIFCQVYYIEHMKNYYAFSSLYLFTFFVFFIFVSGQLNAALVIENSHIDITNTFPVVKIKTVDSLHKNIGNKNLIYVIHTNDSYYFVEQEKPAPKKPKIYIIPEEKIEWIEQRRVK